MKSSEMIKEIRSRLDLSQIEFAKKLGVSFATVNRWEKEHCEPSRIAINAVKRLCANHEIDFSHYEGNRTISSDEMITLFHGSKSGIHGAIAPVSRDRCDFGKGFYMGLDQAQPLTLICNYPKSKLYTVSIDLSGLKILEIEVGLDWALFVAFNRGKLEPFKGSTIYKRFETMALGYDMVLGYIADDRMFVVLDRFFNGEITDLALINCLSALKLGRQCAALTEKACGSIRIIEEQSFSEEARVTLKKKSQTERLKGISMADEICRSYRRQGQFFDEIIKAGE